ncbi:MAG TPA: peptidoglycan-binding protein [Candidatus Omnitrophica bacterium]|nr:peptidoglycan-binding protein [Candidatus Omnitrophota bacterium]
MKRNICVISLVLISVFLICGCNIVPKSVQYQREEKELVGSVDIANPVVEEIQVFLTKNGYDTETQDGRMGQKTRDAIKDFQESIGLKPTGYINEVTLRQIEDTRRAKERKDLEKTYSVEVRSAFPEKSSGVASVSQWTIKDVQAALKNAGFDPGSIDGKLGPRTQQAIKEFQRVKGLKIDGKVGPKTWAELSKYQKK